MSRIMERMFTYECSIKLNVIALNSEIYYDFVSRENGSKPMAYFCKINE